MKLNTDANLEVASCESLYSIETVLMSMKTRGTKVDTGEPISILIVWGEASLYIFRFENNYNLYVS